MGGVGDVLEREWMKIELCPQRFDQGDVVHGADVDPQHPGSAMGLAAVLEAGSGDLRDAVGIEQEQIHLGVLAAPLPDEHRSAGGREELLARHRRGDGVMAPECHGAPPQTRSG